MPLIKVNETLQIDDVTSVSVSDIEEHEDSGGYIRRIEFYTDPINQTNRRPVLTVMIYGEQDALKILTPNLSFIWFVGFIIGGSLLTSGWLSALGSMVT